MSRRHSRLAYLLLLLFPLVLFAPTILGGRALFWGTPLNQFVPWWKYSWEAINSGQFPLWNQLLGMGAPLFANYQSALIYPLTWLYYLAYLIGGTGGMAWLIACMVVLHLFWAGLGMARLVRELGLSRFAQVLAGLAFGLSGYLVARAGFLSINAAAAWLPWIILGATKMIAPTRAGRRAEDKTGGGEREWLPGFLLLVTSLSMQLLAGHAQTAWYSLLLAGAWVVFLGILEPWLGKRRRERETTEGAEIEESQVGSQAVEAEKEISPSRSPARLLVLLLGALVLAAGISAAQLLPTAEYLLESQRSAAVDYEFAMSYSFWPWRFLSFIAPGLFGSPAVGDYWGYANYWEDAVYLGLIPFGLAVGAIITWGKRLPNKGSLASRMIGFLVMVIVFSFVIALGRNTPIFPWLYRYVPTFDMFQAPTRISILAVFSIALLAAVGADSWTRPAGRGLYWLRLGVMAAAAVTVGAGMALLLASNFPIEIRSSFIRGAAWFGFWAFIFGLLALRAPASTATNREADCGWWQWAVVGVLGVNLVAAGWGLNPSVELSVYTEPSPTAAQVQQNLAEGRLYLGAEAEESLKFERFLRFDTFQPFDEGEDWSSLRASLLPNITLLDELNSVNNFDPLLPGRYTRWMEVLEDADPVLREQMLNLMGVTVVESIDLKEAYSIRFESRRAYPRYRMLNCAIQVVDDEAALDLISSATVDHEQQVILETGQDLPGADCQSGDPAVVRMQDEGSNHNKLQVSSSTDGYLVISDVWYPGWRAYLDGELVKIWRANYLFRGIPVPAGQHDLEMVYQPKLISIGMGISAAGLMTFGILLIAWAKMRNP